MSDVDNNPQSTTAISPTPPLAQGFLHELRHTLLRDPLSNLPSLFLLGVAAFGVITLMSAFFIDLLVFPFLLVAIVSSLFATWHIRLLGSMKTQIEHLTEQNQTFTANNEVLSNSLSDMKGNNDRLHQELSALQQLRISLQSYADETKLDFSQLLQEVNQSFEHLAVITQANERVLLQRVAQDLEFLDREVGMKRDEYERFIQRIPEHLQASFSALGDTSFEHIAGDDQRVDHKEVKALVHQVIKERIQIS